MTPDPPDAAALDRAQVILSKLPLEALTLAERLINDIRMCRDREELWQRVGMRDDLSYLHQQIAQIKAKAEGK